MTHKLESSRAVENELALADCGVMSPKELALLARARILTASDLFCHIPKRYEDRQKIRSFPTDACPDAVCVCGTVVDVSVNGFARGQGAFEMVILDQTGGVFGSGKISCRWFGNFRGNRWFSVGQDVFAFGKVKQVGGRLVMDHPEVEVISDDDENRLHVDRIVPVYRSVPGLSQRRLRSVIYQMFAKVDPRSIEWFESCEELSARHQVFQTVHFPDTIEAAAPARRQLMLEVQFVSQLNVLWRRSRYQARTGRVLGKKTTLLKRLYQSLPFDFTGAQKRCIKEILDDMRAPRPMHRLLHGDVGSGKTFVSMAAILLAIDSGCQTALMAPTQILAEQHYKTFCHWLEPLGIRIELRTSQHPGGSGSEAREEPHLIIGTHSLIFKSVSFENLGFIVIDEQHKFGVEQRARLIQQGCLPDVLVMTATPIPRTLLMTQYGDLSVSLLDEKPAGRARIVTALRISPKQRAVTQFVKDQVAKGRQAYLVYPLVNEGPSAGIESAVEAHKKWIKRLGSYRVGLLHGKMEAEEKELVMSDFRAGEIDVLVATTVIEVGVDVPNASVMILHHAERFGLAQLHQLRGRIGRGGHKGYCILLTSSDDPQPLEKLNVLVNQSDGFLIAEEDLRLRGPGDVLGTSQSGRMGLSLGASCFDFSIVEQARALAERVLNADPLLDGTHAGFRSFIGDESDSSDVPDTV